MRIKRTQNNTSNKTTLIVIFSLIAALAVGVSVYALYFSPQEDNKTTIEGVNLERSDAEKAASDALENEPKNKLENGQSDTPSSPEKSTDTDKLAVNVLLSTAGIYNGTVSAGGMITNYQEEGGVCTYIFTNGDNVVTKTSKTLANPTSMSCTTVSFPSSELEVGGIWKVKINYSSASATGTSNEKEIAK